MGQRNVTRKRSVYATVLQLIYLIQTETIIEHNYGLGHPCTDHRRSVTEPQTYNVTTEFNIRAGRRALRVHARQHYRRRASGNKCPCPRGTTVSAPRVDALAHYLVLANGTLIHAGTRTVHVYHTVYSLVTNDSVGYTTGGRRAWNKCRLNHCLEHISSFSTHLSYYRPWFNIHKIRGSQVLDFTSLGNNRKSAITTL